MDGELTNGSARTGALRIDGTQDGAQGDCARDDSARAGAMSAPIVEVRNLVKRYGDVVALDHFDLRIEPGEIFGLLGPNGSGKTTAINCILQLLTFDKGDICLFGEPMTPTRYDLKRKIGVVPQNVALFEELTVRENIDFFCALYVDDRRERARLVDEAIAFVGLEDYVKFRPRKLSGGLLRRLNIACGIAHKPKLILLDEPTVAVDPQSRNKILQGILKLNEEGATIIYTSHYMEEVEQICSRIVIMDKGRNLANGTATELKQLIKKSETLTVEILELTDTQLEAVRRLNHVYDVSYENNRLTVQCSGGSHNLIHLLSYLQEENIAFGRVYSELPTLNDVFLEITGSELRD